MVHGCPYATRGFYRRDKLRAHLKTVHGVKDKVALEVREPNADSHSAFDAPGGGPNGQVAPETFLGFTCGNLN